MGRDVSLSQNATRAMRHRYWRDYSGADEKRYVMMMTYFDSACVLCRLCIQFWLYEWINYMTVSGKVLLIQQCNEVEAKMRR